MRRQNPESQGTSLVDDAHGILHPFRQQSFAERRLVVSLGLVLVLFWTVMDSVSSQDMPMPQLGDPPVAARIGISSPDENGMVTVSGDTGAVFQSAEVVVQNLFTAERVYAYGGVAGNFSIDIAASGNTPFWISPGRAFPVTGRNQPGPPPGGPGTIVYGPPAEPTLSLLPVTQVSIDGNLDDWDDYVSARLGVEIYALLNTESLYIGAYIDVPEDSQLVAVFTLDDITYELAFYPALPQTALMRQIAPEATEWETRTVAIAMNQAQGSIEIRASLVGIASSVQSARLARIYTRPAPDSEAQNNLHTIESSLPIYDEQDGIVPSGDTLANGGGSFSVAGPLAQGAAFWSAEGRINTLTPSPGDTIVLDMDFALRIPDFPDSLVGLNLIGEIGLQPVGLGTDGAVGVATLHTNNGWSSLMTPTGLAIENPSETIPVLTTVTVPAAQIVHRGDDLLAGMRFQFTVPQDLPSGIYVPVFQGKAQIGDGEYFAWEDNGIFGNGPGLARLPLVRLPVTFNVDAIQEGKLLWTLFYQTPSDGTRGIMPDEDRHQAALSNRVRFDSSTLILPPGSYPLEPTLLNQMANATDVTVTPLIPLRFPSGQLQATITRPDGTVDNLPELPIAQNRLSGAPFGAQTPGYNYRLTTLDPVYTGYAFDQLGHYIIHLTGSVEDVYGNRYTGGGTYRVLIADLLDTTPGVLQGTPFYTGDALFIGGRIAPAVPAEVTIRSIFYPVDGGDAVEQTFTGVANSDGYFALSNESLRFDVPGEYRIDYEAHYTDSTGRLWAGSLGSAGIVASPEGSFVARGARGMPGLTEYSDLYRPAWFTTTQYPPNDLPLDLPPILYFPYHNGDIAVIPDGAEGGLFPLLQVQDLDGDYSDWLLQNRPDYQSTTGLSLPDLALTGALPIFIAPDNRSYAYISAARPDLTVRQLVMSQDSPALTAHWQNDDPLNGQIGAGVAGPRPGDYIFLFGGMVVHNDVINLHETAAYASLAIVTDATDSGGVYPAYSGVSLIPNSNIDLFFHPTGVQPGQVLTVGDTLAIAGQVAPTLPSDVAVTITSPSGTTQQFTGTSNPIGYFYDPTSNVAVTDPGIWTVNIAVVPSGQSSTGALEQPWPVGGLPGVIDGTFQVYVVPQDSVPLAWAEGEQVEMAMSPGTPYSFNLLAPDGWSDFLAFYTVRTASYVLETGALPLSGSTLNYQYNPARLSQQFPNLEAGNQGTGSAGSDVVTVTFAITGLDGNGAPNIRTRTFTLLHDRLVSIR